MIQRIVEVVVTPTITSGSAYASGNALGGLLTFSAKGLSDEATITKVVITDTANQKSAIDLLLFNQTFTATADKSAIAISNTDLLNMEGHVSVATGDYITVGTGAIATHTFSGGGLDLITKDGNMQFFGQLVSRGTPTYTSTTAIQITLSIEVWRE